MPIAGVVFAAVLMALSGIVTPLSAQQIELDGEPVSDLAAEMVPLAPEEVIGADGRIWRRVQLRNTTGEVQVWRVQSEILFPTQFEFFVREPTELILLFSARYPYSPQKTRASQGKLISSWPLIMEPGETVELLAAFDARAGIPDFPISLVQEQHYDSVRQGLSYLHGWYIGAAFVLLVFFTVFSILLSSRPARRYAIYFGALVLLNLHSYGYVESLFYGGAQWLYFPLFRLLQIFIMLSYLAFALSFLEARTHHPRLHHWTMIYITCTAGFAAIEAIFWSPFFVLIVDGMALGFLLIGLATAFLALQRRLDGAYLFATGYALLLTTGIINYLASNPQTAPLNNQVDAATLFLQVSDALVFAAAIVSQTFGLRCQRDAALKAQLEASDARVRALEERDRAQRLAEHRRDYIASTSHDLRQPLVSLSLALDRLEDTTPGQTGDLRTGISYLRSLIDDVSAHARSGVATDFSEGDETAEEVFPIQIIFDNVLRLFADEAAEKGLSLKAVPSTHIVEIQPLPLIRMVNNLVSNGIKYTRSGGILIGLRQMGGQWAIGVYDTGPGLAPAELERVMGAYQRGSTSGDNEGEGLGLAITASMAREHGLQLVARSQPGKGTAFLLSGLRVARNTGLAAPVCPPSQTV